MAVDAPGGVGYDRPAAVPAARSAMSRTVPPTLVAVVALWLTLGGAPAGPTTGPAAAPPLDPTITKWFARLADPDPAVRDSARQDLMGLGGGDLPKLLAVVRAARPLRPAQAAVLYDVVSQVYLAAEPYPVALPDPTAVNPQGRPYMIGLRWPEEISDGPARLGVPVVERWPGFPARRWLRDGDMILGVYVDPNRPYRQLPNRPTATTRVLHDTIGEVSAAQGDDPRVVLAVLRDGREIRVAMTLVPQPAMAGGRAMLAADTFVQTRQQQAELYWDQEFAPLVAPDDGGDPTAAAAAGDPAGSLDGPPAR